MAISRNTKQKQIITQEIAKMGEFFSAEELYDKLKIIDESIGIATIYRNLKTMVEKKEINMYMCDRRQVYAKTHNHCHFIDEETGEVIHFDIASLDFLKNKIPGKITSFQIEVRGKLDTKKIKHAHTCEHNHIHMPK
jgi:Fur family transcriptional regulator, ferric uptake regulator